MKTIFATIKSSVYDPSFYRSLLEKPFRFSLQYFFSLIVVLALVCAVIFSISAVPAASSFFNTLGPAIVSYYPEGLEVTFKDGVASSNVEEPFTVALPQELISSDEFKRNHRDIKELLVIDTQETFNLETFKSSGALALLNHDTLAYQDDHGVVRIQPLDEVPNTTVTKSLIASFMGKIQPYLKALVGALPFLIFFGMFAFFVLTLFTLLFEALLVWGLAKIKKLDIGYVKAYQISLHAVTLSLLVGTVLLLLLPGLNIPFLFTILLIFVTWFNLFKKTEAVA